ncbi:hypothetical protein SH1V18_48610 [Vallitalea longa]|uniref:Uncharacterized protein n=1 Tax=Vallitalea longa TaxID=2936439 RepID=A0A9W5YGG3_9FIRM|nr:hypothetical protein [Vallitalea longa]GKX32381.1 hypothetical protein SH1V18_48610 [Vallitalea longa]
MKTPKLKVSITYYFGICKLITSIFLQNEALGVIISFLTLVEKKKLAGPFKIRFCELFGCAEKCVP